MNSSKVTHTSVGASSRRSISCANALVVGHLVIPEQHPS